MLEYRYISIERVITSSLFGNIYGVLFAIRQYEGKSYRVFVELLVEAYYLRIFLHLSHIYTTHILLLHCRNSQKDSVEYYLKNSFFLHITLTDIRQVFVGIDSSSGLKATYTSQYYTKRANLRRKYIKLSLGADLLKQIIC
jgi:hypothetical protein